MEAFSENSLLSLQLHNMESAPSSYHGIGILYFPSSYYGIGIAYSPSSYQEIRILSLQLHNMESAPSGYHEIGFPSSYYGIGIAYSSSSYQEIRILYSLSSYYRIGILYQVPEILYSPSSYIIQNRNLPLATMELESSTLHHNTTMIPRHPRSDTTKYHTRSTGPAPLLSK